MSFGYTRNVATGELTFIEWIAITPGSPPPRPHPTPPPDGGPGPGPGDPPRPMFPIAGGPEPGWPNKPGYPDYIWGNPIYPPDKPPQPGEPPKVAKAFVASVPAGVTPPDAPPADASVVMIDFGKGTKPTFAWVAPYVSTGPIEPT